MLNHSRFQCDMIETSNIGLTRFKFLFAFVRKWKMVIDSLRPSIIPILTNKLLLWLIYPWYRHSIRYPYIRLSRLKLCFYFHSVSFYGRFLKFLYIVMDYSD